MPKYDDASWHSGGDFPADLPPEAGATHIGMFLAWAALSGLGGEEHDMDALHARTVTPGQYLLEHCDGKFIDEDLNDQGNAFAEAYYEMERGGFLQDYIEVLAANLPTPYHAADTWDNFDRLGGVLSQRFTEWQNPRPKSLGDKLRGLFGRR